MYFACHGKNQNLIPADRRSAINITELLEALSVPNIGAIEFMHFSCCEMVSSDNRKQSLAEYLTASNAKWASGYSKSADWLQSMLLDLASIAGLAVPYHNEGKKKNVKVSFRGRNFLKNYNQLVRELGFSRAYKNRRGEIELFPPRQRNT